MITHGKTIISDDLKEQMFHCDIEKCKGACCVEGDLGAPVEEDELPILKEILEDVKPYLVVGDAKSLPYASNSFDLVFSINTVHNLELDECKAAIREISRVSKGSAFITVDAYSNAFEKERMMAWNLTAKTILSVDDWKTLFEEVGYEGDFFWFIP